MSLFSLFFKKNKQKDERITLPTLYEKLKKSSDFRHIKLTVNEAELYICFLDSLIDRKLLQNNIICQLKNFSSSNGRISSLEDIKKVLTVQDIEITADVKIIETKLLQGYVALQIKGTDLYCALVNVAMDNLGLRTKNETENEFSVVGPRIGFIENIGTNMHLIRRKIVTPNLVFREITIGSISKTKVVIAYIDGITNEQNVQTVAQRLQEIEFDIVLDTSQLDQLLSDNSSSPFPTFISTERIDRVVLALTQGQVAVLTDQSPYVITGPSSIMDFFISPEDYYLPWIIGSFFRVIRFLGVMFSILATPVYVAVLTYHYEMLPKGLLGPIIYSRSNVPFPPVLEVLFLEITIELLREAGARLPTKVGQTLGIVGGIVIGQAAVEAALTSNVLLIIVALAALASFTTPIFKMSNTIRFLRFPIIVFAALWGGVGIIVAVCFLLIHLGRLQSLGSPYLVPIYPFRKSNFTDSFIRSSYSLLTKRRSYLRPETLWRYSREKAKKKKDIDE